MDQLAAICRASEFPDAFHLDLAGSVAGLHLVGHKISRYDPDDVKRSKTRSRSGASVASSLQGSHRPMFVYPCGSCSVFTVFVVFGIVPLGDVLVAAGVRIPPGSSSFCQVKCFIFFAYTVVERSNTPLLPSPKILSLQLPCRRFRRCQ
jgi:hypothetical protein